MHFFAHLKINYKIYGIKQVQISFIDDKNNF